MFLKAKNFKYGTAGTSLSEATVKRIADEGASLDISPELITVLTSEGPSPKGMISAGDVSELKVVLTDGSLEDLQKSLGLSGVGAAIASGNSTTVFSKYDFEFETELVVDGVKTAKKIVGSNFYMKPQVKMAFKAKELWYLPIVMSGADDHSVKVEDI